MAGPSRRRHLAGSLMLSKRAMLNKFDRLREFNVKSIELPQIIVFGNQSSGKSSVLESLTGFSLPQDTGLCTRYATQISCRRGSATKVTVSIIPHPDADESTKTRLRAFKRDMSDFTNEALTQILEDANSAMGIRMKLDDANSDLNTFSADILKIDISGPDQEHLTVIDVPGIFRVPSPPVTTDADVALVRKMVTGYMENSRTIILAVLPSNVDLATQEILKMAETADPDGVRTMGVLTKPDLATEAATRDTIKDLVLGKRNHLRLGYCVVKNRGADDRQSTIADRIAQEKAFFNEDTWEEVLASGRCGITSLKIRISDLLMTISENEFPNVKLDVARQLMLHRDELQYIGHPRNDSGSQRMYLGKLSSRFQAITQCALNGHYDSEAIFTHQPSLKLITAITKMNERFANDVWKKGHKRQLANADDEGEKTYDVAKDEKKMPLEVINKRYPELYGILRAYNYQCPYPTSTETDSIMTHIDNVYQANRGSELGTFSASILPITFKEQTEKWEALVLAHVSQSIVLVHEYIFKLLSYICPDKRVREKLWQMAIVDKLPKVYTQAIAQARFLLRIERDTPPSTFNHYFNSIVQKKRQNRITASATNEAGTYPVSKEKTATYVRAIPLSGLQNMTINKDNTQHVREDIHDVLVSYYKVARKRFVDNICRQVIGYILLYGDESPLKILTPELVMGLDDSQLEIIAGEDGKVKKRRAVLEAEIKNLEAATKVLLEPLEPVLDE